MPSYDEMISQHAVTQGSREAASDLSGSAVAASYILQSQEHQNFLSLRYNHRMAFDLTQQTPLAGFQANKFMAAIEEVIMENTEE